MLVAVVVVMVADLIGAPIIVVVFCIGREIELGGGVLVFLLVLLSSSSLSLSLLPSFCARNGFSPPPSPFRRNFLFLFSLLLLCF